MNKEELEKELSEYRINWFTETEFKNFIFETIIPEVLKSVIPDFKDTQTKDDEIN